MSGDTSTRESSSAPSQLLALTSFAAAMEHKPFTSLSSPLSRATTPSSSLTTCVPSPPLAPRCH